MELSKKMIDRAGIGKHDETVASKEVMKHPGPIIHRHEITNKEKQWQDVGSGVFARSFPQSDRMLTTTRGAHP